MEAPDKIVQRLDMHGRRGVPAGAVYVSRAEPRVGLRRSKWANPFRIDKPDKKRDGIRDEVVEKHCAWLLGETQFPDKPPPLTERELELRDRDLPCWCAPDERCCDGTDQN